MGVNYECFVPPQVDVVYRQLVFAVYGYPVGVVGNEASNPRVKHENR